jgi:hypothetical protein
MSIILSAIWLAWIGNEAKNQGNKEKTGTVDA